VLILPQYSQEKPYWGSFARKFTRGLRDLLYLVDRMATHCATHADLFGRHASVTVLDPAIVHDRAVQLDTELSSIVDRQRQLLDELDDNLERDEGTRLTLSVSLFGFGVELETQAGDTLKIIHDLASALSANNVEEASRLVERINLKLDLIANTIQQMAENIRQSQVQFVM